MPDKVINKDRLKEITASIEDNIKDLFQSEKYAQYLRTMSRFHRYSANNTMLIYMQKPDATLCAGFNKWKNQFERNVKKGEKGIKIIAPTPYKKKIEEMKLDPDTKAPMLDENGNAIMEEKTIQIPMYKVVSVFDVSQTEGKPLPELAANLTGSVENYEVFMEALKRSAPVPISFEPMDADMDGYFSTDAQRIAIREGMSEKQTVSAAIHEIAHSKLHNSQQEKEKAAAGDEAAAPIQRKSRETEEVEAESISFAVCAYYGIETGENSFGYISTWSSDKELPEFRASLETINKTSSGLISDIDRHYREIVKERGLDQAEPDQAANEVAAAPDFKYKLHANPRSTNEKDAAFIQAYEQRDGDLYPGAVIGIGAYEDFIPLVNRLNDEKAKPEDALALADEYAYKPTPENDEISGDYPSVPIPETGVEEPPPLTAPDNGYLPDPAMTVEAMNAYGYTDADMLPLSRERAIELFQRDVPVYMLYDDNSEAMAFDTDEIIAFGGMLGVTTADWELAPEDLKSARQDLEQAFLNSPADAFAIYQLKAGEEYRDLRFERYDTLEQQGLTPDRANYDLAYTAPLAVRGEVFDRLNAIYDTFNNNRPADFTGHSASVSDIIALKQDGTVSYHYIDAWGFKELPNFQKPENYLKAAEMSMEDDYGMIDGVINNGVKQPTVEELEQQSKSGQPISLMDLAAATHRERDAGRKEKKPSLLAQLKSYQDREKTSTAPKKSAEREI